MDEYGLSDLRRQLMASRANLGTPLIHLPPDAFRHFTPPPPPPPPRFLALGGDQQLVVPGGGGGSLVDHHYNNNTLTAATSAAAPPHPPTATLYGNNGSDQLEHVSWSNNNMDDGGNNSGRWPRQETLTLLEIRSALDSSFKETNHKGPLWDQVSRIMGEEHGYQRSGKKCKEKFENLYKYYKKTKEGKAGRQDGKNYRFFRQLEAIYGDHHQTNLSSPTFINPFAPNRDFHLENNQEIVGRQHHQLQGLDSFSNNSTEFDQTSSSENNSCLRPVVKKRWREKVEGFVSSQIGKVMKAQEEWTEKMVKSIEQREEERMVEEEERRKREAARFDHQVHEFWAKERAWVEVRDAAMMKALSKITRKENVHSWSQHEVASLMEVSTSLELSRIQEEGVRPCLKEGIWEEIAVKMGCLGYRRSVGEYKEKWEGIKMSNMYSSQLSCYDEHEEEEVSRERWPEGMMRLQLMDDQGISPSGSKPDVSSSSFRIPSNGGENLWGESRYG